MTPADDNPNLLESEAEWHWFTGALRASDPTIDLALITEGAQRRIRRRQLHKLSLAAAVLLAVSLVGWQVSRQLIVVPQNNQLVVNPPTAGTSPSQESPATPRQVESPASIHAVGPTDIAKSNRRWRDELDRQLADVEREVGREQSRRSRNEINFIENDLAGLELELNSNTW